MIIMKQLLAIFLSLLLSCGYVAYGETEKTPAVGLLSLDEVAALEDSYGLSQEELMKRLSITEADLEYRDEFMIIPSEKQIIHDLLFSGMYGFSAQEPTGLYVVQFATSFGLDQKEAAREAFNAFSEEAAGLYGEPGQGPIISTSTVDGVTGEGITTRWKIGTQSSFTLSYSEQPDGVYVQLTYRLVIPGSIHDFG